MTRSQFPECAPQDAEIIRQRIRTIRENIRYEAGCAGRNPDDIALMAVTKTVDPGRVNAAISEGVSLLGENRSAELREKFQFYNCKPDKIHFIGHLQTNKIRDIIRSVSCVESVDSVHLADALNTFCTKENLSLKIMLQVNIGREIQKSGLLPEDVANAARTIAGMPAISICGLMTVPPRGSGDLFLLKMAELRERLNALSIPGTSFRELSMGMSEDYRLAVRCGATIVRIGRGIFGERT